ncbi:WD40 repeat-like protein [Fomitiporia mediterranea MF3/22]|uniref:WD40 repeat-like protein n=1 Tax=Fomitiporia mediterranea (strain MF3/22) TaxID=694068 RepID=UPI000440963A|nr:WD40 repeat-like protein [Fomitiporia mediterranea MF3/22]EJD08195.1 WD40 repeat-like protein [Fomitiporia mediterranea MF3/22]
MSGLKNSPFGKRLRAPHPDTDIDDDRDAPARNKPRVNPIFGVSNLSTPSLDSRSTDESAGPSSPELRPKDYNDRFVPSRDEGDIRTSYNLMDDGGPQTPSRTHRMIPTESDALREQANTLFNSILHTEVTPPNVRESSPERTTNANASTSASTSALPTTPSRKRLFNFTSPSRSSNPSTPTRRLDTPTDEVYSLSPVRAESRRLLESPQRKLRTVCKTPYRVLDAPDLADDFYLNLVDWSSTNILGVGLGSCVYLWTAHTAVVSKLCDLQSQTDTISSLSWVQKGTTLAIGTLSGRLHIYDAHTLQLLRSYPQAHAQRVGALAWNQHVLSSGSRDRLVHHRDVREANQRPFRKCAGHRQEVCGLKWSGEGGGVQSAMLASGGNDNKVCIWDLRGSRRASVVGVPTSTSATNPSITTNSTTFTTTTSDIAPPGVVAAPSTSASTSTSTTEDPPGDQPLYKFHEHTAAVKALAWDPHVPGILATGGGTQDKTIRFWNVLNGSMLNYLDTGSQVCNLTWSLTSHELVSTHGFSSSTAQNQICIWKYPSLDMVASLTGHTHRVLYLAMSPDGETIVTGAGDETLRFWNAFPSKKEVERGRRAGREGGSKLDFGRLIR